MDTSNCPEHAGMRGSEVSNHVSFDAVAKDRIPMDRTDRLKSVAKKLGREEENARVKEG